MKYSSKFFRPGRRGHLAADRPGVDYWTPHSVLSHANAAAVEREPVQHAVDHGLDGDEHAEEHREGSVTETRRRQRAGDASHLLRHLRASKGFPPR
jgi:hypothetical protein